METPKRIKLHVQKNELYENSRLLVDLQLDQIETGIERIKDLPITSSDVAKLVKCIGELNRLIS